MARRARSTPKAGIMIGALVVALLLIALGGYFLGAGGIPYRTVPEFPVQ